MLKAEKITIKNGWSFEEFTSLFQDIFVQGIFIQRPLETNPALKPFLFERNYGRKEVFSESFSTEIF
jgi:hypothetical protein